MTRTPKAASALGGALLLAVSAMPAQAQDRRTIVSPYIELGQDLTADLQTGDVLTYSTIAAGIDAAVETRRVQAQVSYRYERRISWNKRVGDDDVHSGLARISASVAPSISIDAGALAARARSDIRGAAPGVLAGNVDNISQVYSVYAGPTVVTNAGPVGVSASYRFGYTKVEAPGDTGVPAGAPPLDRFDSETSHVVQVSAATKAGDVLPIGVTASAAYERDDARQLDQRYEGYYGRVDTVTPVSPTVAVTAGAGYEKIKVSARDAVTDAVGNPVVNRDGRYVTDQSSPRRIAYETDGLIWDAGIIWRPSARTTLQARVGRRYGGWTYTGSLSYAVSRSVGLQVGVYDSVDTFGRQLRNGLANLPTSFIQQRDAFAQQFSGCTFGTAGDAPGGCLNGVFQSITASSYRARGIDAVIAASRGGTSYGIGAGYANRRFYAPGGTTYSINGITDQSYYVDGFVAVPLTYNSGLNGDIFANYYESGLANAYGSLGSSGVTSVGATGTYYHNFGRLGASASLGLYSFSQQGVDDQLTGTAQVAMRYQF